MICRVERSGGRAEGDYAGQKFGAAGNKVVVEEFLEGPKCPCWRLPTAND
ncbi:MAG: hypothetical protein ACLS4Z_08220 [Christensenellaceae bacterium]